MTKHQLTLYILLLINTLATAQKGIQFDESPMADVLAKAKAEKKMVFLDAYTTWCGPCKMLERNTFPDTTLGAFMNKYFVSTSKDMERGEGVALARKYSVAVYPTLIFLDSDGNVVHRDAGYLDAKAFMELAKIATNNDTNLSSFEQRFKNGDREPQFLFKYMQMRYKMADNSHDEVAQAFLKTQPDWNSEVGSRTILQFIESPSSEGFNYLLKNKETFVQKYGITDVMSKIEQVVTAELNTGFYKTPTVNMDSLLARIYPEQQVRLSKAYAITYAFKNNNPRQYIAAANEYLQQFPPDDPAVYDDVALRLIKLSPRRKMVKQAEKWIELANKKEVLYENYLTLAQIYDLRGKRRCMREAATKAIEIGKAAKQDVSAAERFLTNKPQ